MSDSVPGRSHSRSLSLPACVSCSLLLTSWFATVASGNLRRPIFLLDFKHSCYRVVVLTVSKCGACLPRALADLFGAEAADSVETEGKNDTVLFSQTDV